MGNLSSYGLAKKTRDTNILGYGLSGCFLIIHITMLLLFQHYGVTPMVYFNIGSIVFYLLTFILLKKRQLYIYAVLTYLEVVAHMSAATVLVGADAGFQVTLIGLNFLVFYAEYLSISLDLRRVHAPALCLIGMLSYMGSYAYSKMHTPPYEFPKEACFWLQLAWGATVFIITIFFLEMFVRITTHSEKQLDALAKHDPLTGLYNRAGYEQRISKTDISRIALLITDVDNFKTINDTYGHDVGDRVLKKTAEALMENFRLDDFLSRIGGDEFAAIIVSPEGLPEDLIKAKIDHINNILADTSDGLPAVSISAGVAYGSEADNITTLFKNADTALYMTKQAGRKGCSFYHSQDK